jgi:ferric-dicitrate binding protein FerR (iron transport regulator)
MTRDTRPAGGAVRRASRRHRDYHHVVERDRRARQEQREASEDARASIARVHDRRFARRLRLGGGCLIAGLLGTVAILRWIHVPSRPSPSGGFGRTEPSRRQSM